MTAIVRPSARVPATVFILTFVALLAMFASRTSSASAATYSSSTYNFRLLQLVNSARAQHGLPTLRVASGITSVASSWTAHLAAQRALSHNPNLVYDVEHHGSASATVVAENVGEGATSDPDGLFTAYMNSPEHRANILDGQMRYIGIAVDFAGGYAWNTMDFVDRYGSTTSTTSRASSPRPSHSTTRTSSARTSSTTHRSATPTRHRAAKPAARPSHPAASREAPARRKPVATQAARAALADLQVTAASLPNSASHGALTGGAGDSSSDVPPVAGVIAVALIGGLATGHLLLRRGLSSR